MAGQSQPPPYQQYGQPPQPPLPPPQSPPNHGYQPYQPYQGYGSQQPAAQQPHAPGPGVVYAPPSQPYSPQTQQFVPSTHQQQQHQGYSMPGFSPGPPGPSPAVGAAQSQPQQAGAGFMSGLTSPLGLMGAGLLSGPQAYMTEKVGWLRTNITSGTMGALFSIDSAYVRSKLLMLLAPYLRSWGYLRQLEQISGGQKYKPPRLDVNAPDLYLPLMGAWTYVLLACVAAAATGKFTPDVLSARIYGACIAWAVHWGVARALLRGMSVTAVPWAELLAYTGYAFLPVCAASLAGAAGGRVAYYAVWGYGSLAMGVFLVKSMKRLVLQEGRHHGRDLSLTNYLLLALAAFQFPFALWLGLRPPK